MEAQSKYLACAPLEPPSSRKRPTDVLFQLPLPRPKLLGQVHPLPGAWGGAEPWKEAASATRNAGNPAMRLYKVN